jgi:hypothetical protein
VSQRIAFRFAPVPHDMLFDHNVPSQVVVLWAAIYRLADLGGGVAAIDQVDLGKELGWSDDTVARWAKKGATLGWVAVRRRGQGFPNEYQALILEPAELRDQEPAETRTTSAELRDLSSISETTKRDAQSAALAASFDAFWKLYPLKKDKGHARLAYAKALKIATAAEINDGLDRAIPGLRKRPEFIPYAATWLNGERWTDVDAAAESQRRVMNGALMSEFYQ